MRTDGSCQLFRPSLQNALAESMLPALGPKDLGRLACASRSCWQLVSLGSLQLWQNTASQVLPVGHPASQSSQASSIRAALSSFGVSQANLRQGKVSLDPDIKVLRALETPKFAPCDGRTFAVLAAVHPRDCINELIEKDLLAAALALGHRELFSIIVVKEDGTSFPLIWRPKVYKPYRGWQWSCDGQQIVYADVSLEDRQLHIERADVNTKTSSSQSIPLVVRHDLDDLDHPNDVDVLPSAHGEYIMLHMGRIEDRQALVYNSSTGQLVKSFDIFYPDHGVSDSCMPLWHPKQLSLAMFVGGVLHVHDIENDQTLEIPCVSPRGQGVVGCELHCWSPCGDLLCISFRTVACDSDGCSPGESMHAVRIVRADGSGTVFTLYGPGPHHPKLSDASTGLISIWNSIWNSSDVPSDDLSVYDIYTGTLMFKRSTTEKVSDHHTGKSADFLFGPLMAFTVVDSEGVLEMEVLPDDDFQEADFNTVLHPTSVSLIDLRRPAHDIMLKGDWVLEATWFDAYQLAACSPLGDRMLLRRRVRTENGTLQPCVRLVRF